MRVEPEHVLPQQRVAAARRIEQADPDEALDRQQKTVHRQHRGRGQHDDADRVDAPDEQRQPHPGHAGRAQAMDRHDEIQRRHDRRKAVDEHGHRRGEDIAVGVQRRIRRVESPAGIDAAHDQGIKQHQPGKIEDVPAGEIEAREGEIVRADHQRDEEIAERRRDRRDQKEPHHDDAVHREHAVVDVGLQQAPSGVASCSRISVAAKPPMKKKNVIEAKNISAMRLWSRVSSHEPTVHFGGQIARLGARIGGVGLGALSSPFSGFPGKEI